MEFFTNILSYFIKIVFDLYITAVILRILLQLVKTEPNAPFKILIFKITDIPLKFIEKIIPKILNINIVTILFNLILKTLEITIFNLLHVRMPNITSLMMWSIISFIIQVLNIYFYIILSQILISWIIPLYRSRLIDTLNELSNPILKPLRRIIPNIAGFDMTPLIAIILLQIIIIIIAGPITKHLISVTLL